MGGGCARERCLCTKTVRLSESSVLLVITKLCGKEFNMQILGINTVRTRDATLFFSLIAGTIRCSMLADDPLPLIVNIYHIVHFDNGFCIEL